MTKKQKGFFFIALPFIIFLGSLILLGVASLVIAQFAPEPTIMTDDEASLMMASTGLSESNVWITIARVTRVILGFTGIASIFTGPLFMAYGIYILVKKEEPIQNTPNNTPTQQ